MMRLDLFKQELKRLRLGEWEASVASEHYGYRLEGCDVMHFIPRAMTQLLVMMACLLTVIVFPSFAGAFEPPHVVLPLDPHSPYRASLFQLQHRSYLLRDGAPFNAQAIAQTPDGFLWIGSQYGLTRFDGVHFDQSLTDLLPKTNVSRLFADSNGDLWIGYLFGGISVLHQGKISSEPEGALPGGTVLSIFRAKDGALWVATSSGIARQRNGFWKRISRPNDGDSKHMPAWFGEINGHIYLFESQAAYVIDEKTEQLLPTDFAQAKHDQFGLPPAVPWNDSYNVYWTSLRDPSGAIWLTRSDRFGITRLRWMDNKDATPSEERFGKENGLSGDWGLVYFMDREGNLWVATEDGIDRFNVGKFTPTVFPTTPGLLTLAADHVGGVWVGSHGEDYLYFKGDAPPVRISGLGTGAECSMVDKRDIVWVGDYSDLGAYDGVHVTHIAAPPGAVVREHSKDTLLPCQNVAEDAAGDIWVSINTVGVFRRSGNTWQLNGGLKGLPSESATRVIADDKGRIWLGYPDNRIAVIDRNQIALYGSKDGLDIGNVMSLAIRGEHVWVAGDKGVAYLPPHQRFITFQAKGGNSLRTVSGIVETARGELWLNSSNGVYRFAANEVEALLRTPGYQPSYELFTQDDGIDGRPLSMRPSPSMVESTDGRIWVATDRTLSWIDPSHIRHNIIAPTTLITGFTADEKSWPPTSSPTVPPLMNNLRIDYTAPTLSNPERVHFRYRLQGVDDSWQDVGDRRQAFYTHLQPGTYHFEVLAINEDGIVSRVPADLMFSVAPTFYQTVWFKSLLVGLALLIAWCAYKLRISFIARRYRLLLHERSSERERIARDLHDTLLQGMQGMLMQIELWIRGLTLSDAQRDSAHKIEDKMRSMLIEGRDAISALRQSHDQQADFIADLLAVGNEPPAQSQTKFSVRVLSDPRELRPDVCDEVLAITREAVLNAFRHAEADALTVTVDYARQGLIVSICDNGVGMSEHQREERLKEGHWGVAGMRERAAKLGGDLVITSAPEKGTRVTLQIPRRRAYAADRSFLLDRPFRSKHSNA